MRNGGMGKKEQVRTNKVKILSISYVRFAPSLAVCPLTFPWRSRGVGGLSKVLDIESANGQNGVVDNVRRSRVRHQASVQSIKGALLNQRNLSS